MATIARKGAKFPTAAVPALIWVLTRIGLPLLLLYGLLWWRADAAIEKQLNRARGMFDISRSGTVLGLNGDVGMRNITITPLDDSGLPKLTVKAERAVIHTPGLFWLVRTSLFGPPKEIPSRFGFRVDGVEFDGDPADVDKALIGGHIVFPFDLAGCDTKMSRDVMRELGGESAKTSFELTMSHPSAKALQISWSSETPTMIRGVGETEVALGSGDEVGQQLATASLQNVQVTYTDLGFAAKRNEYCQKRTGLDAAQFNARHVEAASQTFAPRGIKPGAALTQAYARFAKDGGTLTLTAKPLRPMYMVAVRGIDLENLGLFVHATVRHDQDAPGAVTFLAVDRTASPMSSTPDQVAVAAAPIAPAGATVARSASANGSVGLRVAPGGEIAYDDLGAYVGQEVDVVTNINTTRHGKLLGTSSLGLSLAVLVGDGGYTLSIPKYQIVNVSLAAAPLAVIGKTESAAHAQTN
jgi:hypothetical protein